MEIIKCCSNRSTVVTSQELSGLSVNNLQEGVGGVEEVVSAS
jgi:hypothetical protein